MNTLRVALASHRCTVVTCQDAIASQANPNQQVDPRVHAAPPHMRRSSSHQESSAILTLRQDLVSLLQWERGLLLMPSIAPHVA